MIDIVGMKSSDTDVRADGVKCQGTSSPHFIKLNCVVPNDTIDVNSRWC